MAINCLIFFDKAIFSFEFFAIAVINYITYMIMRVYFIDEEENSTPLFLRFFILTPANVRNFFCKEGAMITYLLFKKTYLFFWKNLLNFFRNLVGTSRLNPTPIFLWRPLIKRWSYFGLYVHSRSGFLKTFKNRNFK